MAEQTLLTGRQKKVLDRAKKRWKDAGMSEGEIKKRLEFMKRQMRQRRNPQTSGGYLRTKQQQEATMEQASEY
jgi:hypothetical protein